MMLTLLFWAVVLLAAFGAVNFVLTANARARYRASIYKTQEQMRRELDAEFARDAARTH